MAATGKSSKVGRKLDKVLFGIPENRAKFMRTGKANRAVTPARVEAARRKAQAAQTDLARARYRFGFDSPQAAAADRKWKKASDFAWTLSERLRPYHSVGQQNNPATKRAVYRLGLESAKRNPGDPSAALVAAERTVIFKEAALTDVAGAREFFLAGYHDGLSEERNPKGTKGEFQKCVEAVAAKGGAYDPRAVCASMEREKYGQKELTRRAVAGKKRAARGNPRARPLDEDAARLRELVKRAHALGSDFAVKKHSPDAAYIAPYSPEEMARDAALSLAPPGAYAWERRIAASFMAGYRKKGLSIRKARGNKPKRVGPRKNPHRNPRNPMDTAQEAYAGFHGEPSKRTVVIQEKRHFHTHVWALGPLVYLKVWLPSDRRKPGLRNYVDLEFDYESKNPVLVTANENRNQMFFDGGDQSVDLKVFGVPSEPHETVVLGEVSDAYYFTTKKHLGKEGGTAVYKHRLGEEGGERPTLLYHVLEKRLSLAGGSYTIPNEGVRN